MPITSAQIEAHNQQESQYDTAFFTDFARQISVYEDDDLWVVNKPAGLLSVDGKSLKVSLLSRLQHVNPAVKLIHRLDMDTSGLIIFAKNASAQTHISKQFIARLPQKQYEAVVFGKLTDSVQGRIEVPVRYEPSCKPRHIVDETWHKPALTDYTVMAHELLDARPVTRVALKPITGRSHQLRVHMQHLGHVIVGDSIYAQGPAQTIATRLYLHAHKLRLKHPSLHSWMDWQSPVPF